MTDHKDSKLLSSALWRRTDTAMFECCRLSSTGGLYFFEGTVLAPLDNEPAEIRYEIIAAANWQSLAARVRVQRGHEQKTVEISRDGLDHWSVNGTIHPEFDGLQDLDLAFSPCSNTLPIRRLSLPMGGSANVTALWLRFPQLDVKPLAQKYTRIAEFEYRYESNNGQFKADLEVDREGLVINYDQYWRSAL